MNMCPGEPGRWLCQLPANHSVLLASGRVAWDQVQVRPALLSHSLWVNYWTAGAQGQLSTLHRRLSYTTARLTLIWKLGHISTQNRQRSLPSWNLHSSGRGNKMINKPMTEAARRWWTLSPKVPCKRPGVGGWRKVDRAGRAAIGWWG